MKEEDQYPYPTSLLGLYTLTKDGVVMITDVTELECWQYIHRHHCYSVEHAIRYEGYRILPKQELGTVDE